IELFRGDYVHDCLFFCFPVIFNNTPPSVVFILSLHDALPIFWPLPASYLHKRSRPRVVGDAPAIRLPLRPSRRRPFQPIRLRRRSEEHTSELQSREKLVCRLLLEKKNSLPSDTCLPRPRIHTT